MNRKAAKLISAILAITIVIAMQSPFSFVYAKEDKVQSILDSMTLTEKIEQTLMVDFRTWDTNGDGETEDVTYLNCDIYQAISEYNFGAVILFGENIKTTENTFYLTQSMQAAATSDGGTPLLIATDQEGGNVTRLASGTALPGNLAIGATGNTDYAKMAGEVSGSELASLGINVNLSPVLDINNNPNNVVIGKRSYGEDPQTAGEMGSAYITGLNEYGVAGCAKHFPGHGDTETDSHYGLPTIDKSYRELKNNELKPFQTAIDNGIDMIMTAHILYPQIDSSTIYSEKTGKQESRPATLSEKIITDILKGDMGFEGVVCTDGMNMAGITDTFDEDQAVVEALAAGADMICMPATKMATSSDLSRIEKIIDKVKEAVESGYISTERIDDAVTRILTLKEKRGILDYDPDDYTFENAENTVGSDENKEKERDIASAAVTVVKNENDTLPYRVKKKDKVLILCPYENEPASFIMGWNRAKENGLIPSSATIKTAVFTEDGQNDSEIKELIKWANTVIINSEVNSTSKMTGSFLSEMPQEYVQYCKKKHKKSIVISSGLPYDVQLYDDADAIAAVYGSKGSTADAEQVLLNGDTSVANENYGPNLIAGMEVILGNREASGTLPVSIYEFDSETKEFTDNKLYSIGDGITYTGYKNIKECEIKLEYETTEYDGEIKEPKVTIDGLKQGEDFKVIYKNNVDAGTAKITITGIGNVIGSTVKTFKIEKAPVEIKISSRIIKVSALKLKFRNAYGSAIKIKNLPKYTSVNYSIVEGSDKISILCDGTVKVKKGTKKGKYKIKVEAYANESANYLESEKVTKEIVVIVK